MATTYQCLLVGSYENHHGFDVDRRYRFYEHCEEQKVVLRRQTAIAMELNLPIVIHSRDAEHDIIEELEKVS